MTVTATRRRRPPCRGSSRSTRTRSRASCRSSSASATSMQVPTLEKIVINMGVGRATAAAVAARGARSPTSPLIAGQKPIVTKAKTRSPASSCARASRSAARSRSAATACGSSSIGWSRRHPPHPRLPRPARPTRGTAGATTRSGSTSRRCSPRSTTTRSTTPRGMDITIVTTADDNEAGKALLDAFGFPFKKGADADNEPAASEAASAAAAVRRRRGRSERAHGKEGTDQQGEREAEVQGPRLHPLPSLRPGPFGATASSVCAVCACASSPTPARSPA